MEEQRQDWTAHTAHVRKDQRDRKCVDKGYGADTVGSRRDRIGRRSRRSYRNTEGDTACHGQGRPSSIHTAWESTQQWEGLSRPQLFRVHMCTCVCARTHTRVHNAHSTHAHVCPHGYMCPHTQVYMPTRVCRGGHMCRCAHMYTMYTAHMHVCPHMGTCAHTYRCTGPHACVQKSRHTHRCTDLTGAPPPSSKPPLTGCGITLSRLYSDPLSHHTPKPEERSS